MNFYSDTRHSTKFFSNVLFSWNMTIERRWIEDNGWLYKSETFFYDNPRKEVNVQKKSLFYFLLSAFILTGLVCSGLLQASDSYPEKAVKIIVPYKPGGLSDNSGRILAKFLSDHFGKPFVVTNIHGAGGTVGSRTALKAKPDGYTLLWHHQSMLVGYVTGVANFNWDGYTVIGRGLLTNSVLVVAADSPWKTLIDLVEDAKKKPNQIKFGTNLGAASYFVTLSVANAADAEFRIVGGGGDSVRIQQILGGHTDCGTPGISAALPYIEAGKLRPLAMIGPSRLPGIDIPTGKEQGIDATLGFDMFLYAPKGTPDAVVDKLSSALKSLTQDADTMKKYQNIGFFPGYLDQEDAEELLKVQTQTYVQLGKKAGVAKVDQ